jgi:hypothetical protein
MAFSGAMTRWSDGEITPALLDVLETKGGYRKQEMAGSPACANCGGSPICFSAFEPGRWVWEMGRRPLEMLKMKIDPTMCMKTQKTVTKCHPKNPVLCGKTHRTSGNRRKSVELAGRKCTDYVINTRM